MRAEQTSFLFGANAPFIEELYARYLGDPNAVDAEWRTFFEALAEDKATCWPRCAARAGRPTARASSARSIPMRLPSPANRNVKGGNGAAALPRSRARPKPRSAPPPSTRRGPSC